MTQDVFCYWIEKGFIPKLAPAADKKCLLDLFPLSL